MPTRKHFDRRHFLQLTAAVVTTSALCPLNTLAGERPVKRSLKKGYMLNTFPGGKKAISVLEQFKMLKEAGFEGVEPSSELDPEEVLKARDATGLTIASMSCGTTTRSFSSANAMVREKAVQALVRELKNAKDYGATSVLVVPGGVSADVSYVENYQRCQECIRKALPTAEKLGVKMALENVWNNFLLSPLEAVRFVDDFKSPWVGWHFDVGNVMYIGWPEHWIRALDKRIAKVHIKEFSRKKMNEQGLRAGFSVEYLEGDNNWARVMKAFDDINYNGWFIIESSCASCKQGMEPMDYLTKVSAELDKIIAS
ncbi:MAG: sugar phosphate isomerase/epimerase [Verrucomicrobiales bacterium]|nr:sugar phosphate isomerase/epimerase [Verrucomicrobiales bacterium]